MNGKSKQIVRRFAAGALTQAEAVRALHAEGCSKPEVLEALGCSRQAYDAAIKATRKVGRPRVKLTADELAHKLAQLEAISAASATLISQGGAHASRSALEAFAAEVLCQVQTIPLDSPIEAVTYDARKVDPP